MSIFLFLTIPFQPHLGFVNEVTSGNLLELGEIIGSPKLVAWGANHVIGGLELPVLPPISWEGKRGED